jgi:hypothetical protein
MAIRTTFSSGDAGTSPFCLYYITDCAHTSLMGRTVFFVMLRTTRVISVALRDRRLFAVVAPLAHGRLGGILHLP